MLNKLHIFVFFLTGLLFISCTSTRDLPQKALFSFEFEDDTYQIVSISSASGEGMNYLTKIVNDTSVFRTLDQDQDGIIDLVQYGSVTMQEANLIYTYGIREAQNNGKLKERQRDRIFRYSEEELKFTVQTFGTYSDLLYNRFIISNIEKNTKESFLDFDADGILDESELSNLPIEEFQPFYKKVLQQGIEQKRIQLYNEKYVVKVAPKETPS